MDFENHQLTLRNGAPAEVRSALVEYYSLLALLDSQPRHFGPLLALAQGKTSEVPPESKHYLMEIGSLAPDGSLPSLTRDVLLSAYQPVPDGHHLVQPFQLAGTREKLIVDQMDKQLQRQMNDLLKGTNEEGRSRG